MFYQLQFIDLSKELAVGEHVIFKPANKRNASWVLGEVAQTASYMHYLGRRPKEWKYECTDEPDGYVKLKRVL